MLSSKSALVFAVKPISLQRSEITRRLLLCSEYKVLYIYICVSRVYQESLRYEYRDTPEDSHRQTPRKWVPVLSLVVIFNTGLVSQSG